MNKKELIWAKRMYNAMQEGILSWKDLTAYQEQILKMYMNKILMSTYSNGSD